MSRIELQPYFYLTVSESKAKEISDRDLQNDLIQSGIAWVEGVTVHNEKHKCALKDYQGVAYEVPQGCALDELTHKAEHLGFRKITQAELKVFCQEAMKTNTTATFVCNGSYWNNPTTRTPQIPVAQLGHRIIKWSLIPMSEVNTLKDPLIVFIKTD